MEVNLVFGYTLSALKRGKHKVWPETVGALTLKERQMASLSGRGDVASV